MALTYDTVAGAGPDLSAFLKPREGGAKGIDLLVQGARCANCMAKIEKGVAALPDVEAARLNLTSGKLTVTFRTGAVANPGAVLTTVEGLGYSATPFDPGAAVEAHDREGRRLALALGVAAFGAGNAMMFSVPLWAGLFGQELGPATRTMMQWWSALIGAPCALYAGMPFFQSAWRSLKVGRANMDVPISIGVLLTLAISFVETLLHGRDAYFDAAVSLLFLLLIGRWLDHQLRAKARSAAADLLALQAPYAVVLDEAGHEQRKPLAEVAVGDRLIVRPGERVPVDAVVEAGSAELDNALLTGETRPEPVAAGSRIQAGALNLTQEIEHVLKDQELLITAWSPFHLHQLLKTWFWKDGVVAVSAQTVWHQSCQQLYLPRLLDSQVFQATLNDGLDSRDFFAIAQGQEGQGDEVRYLGFSFGKRIPFTLDAALLLIEPGAAAAYVAALQAAERAAAAARSGSGTNATAWGSGGIGDGQGSDGASPGEGDGRGVGDPTRGFYQSGGGATIGGGASAGGVSIGPGGAITGGGGLAGVPSPKKRFYGGIDLDPILAKKQFADLVDEVVQQFTTRMGVKVKISVEIQAESGLGFDADLQRAVRENCRTLKFKNAEFEEGD